MTADERAQIVAETEAQIVAWLLSDDARLSYEAGDQREHFSWWAADAIERGDHKGGQCD